MVVWNTIKLRESESAHKPAVFGCFQCVIWERSGVSFPSIFTWWKESKAWLCSLKPRLSILDFVFDFSPKVEDKIRNGKLGFKAEVE